MSLTIQNQSLILHKIVFELKYRHGFTYLDKCGRTINMIQKTSPEWFISSEAPNPQGSSLISLSNSCFLNFSSSKLDLSVERRPVKDPPMGDEDVDRFADQVDTAASVIVDQLGLQEFSRIGFRAWYLYPVESLDKAEAWLRSLSFYTISGPLVSAFGGNIEALSVAVVLQGADRKYRIGFNGAELQTQIDVGQGVLNLRPRSLHKNQRDVLLEQEKVKKRIKDNPEFAAMIDMDAYQDDPEVVQPRDFVVSSYQHFVQNMKQAASGGQG